MGDNQPIFYVIDGEDRITETGGGWTAFATANGADASVVAPVGRSLWSAMLDRQTRDVYKRLLTAVRSSGIEVSFPIRCDAPTVERWMRMTLTPAPNGRVAFKSELLRAAPARHRFPFAALPYRPPPVPTCSVCRRVHLAARWQGTEQAAASGLLPTDADPVFVIYRLCPGCRSMLERAAVDLLARRRATDDSTGPTRAATAAEATLAAWRTGSASAPVRRVEGQV